MMKVLVTGCNGQVGTELMGLAAGFGIDAVGVDYAELDITDAGAVTKVMQELQPQAVINAAAYTAVDKAESESEQAYAVNRDGPANLASACAEHNIPLLHISTDYVFDGNKQGAYTEEDDVQPLGVYGKSKLAGDVAVRETCTQSIILRTSWVFSAHGNNFVKTMLRLGQEREQLAVVADQTGCPTAAREIAHTLYNMLVANVEAGSNGHWGTYHFCQPEPTNWHSFAEAIFAEARAQGIALKVEAVRPITTKEYPTAAQRPANSVLDCSKIEKDFNLSIKPWQESLAEVIKDLGLRT
jgi:dTDP-4-dehydrorhamnose reductase